MPSPKICVLLVAIMLAGCACPTSYTTRQIVYLQKTVKVYVTPSPVPGLSVPDQRVCNILEDLANMYGDRSDLHGFDDTRDDYLKDHYDTLNIKCLSDVEYSVPDTYRHLIGTLDLSGLDR